MKPKIKFIVYWSIVLCVLGGVLIYLIITEKVVTSPYYVAIALAIIPIAVWFWDGFLTRVERLHPYIFFKKLNEIDYKDFHMAEFNNFYLERESDKKVRERLKNYENIIIIGKPLSGKTRAVYNHLNKIKTDKKFKDFWFVKPAPVEKEELFKKEYEIPKKDKAIIVFDDLNKFVEKEFPIDVFTRVISKSKKSKIVVIATCRSGNEYEKVKEVCKEVRAILRKEIELQDISKENGKKIAKETGKSMGEFDGTPGSITLGLEEMRTRYKSFNDYQKSILKCIKLLNSTKFFLTSIDLVRKVLDSEMFNHLDPFKFDENLNVLKNNSFLSSLSDFIYLTNDVYCEKIIEFEPMKVDFMGLKENFKEKELHEELLDLGNFFSYEKDFENAEDCYRNAIEVNSKYAIAHYNLGILLNNFRRYEEAEKEYREAIRINPQYALVHNNLGYLLKRLKRHEEAEKEFIRAIEINPSYALANQNLAEFYFIQKYYEKSLEIAENALKISKTPYEKIISNFLILINLITLGRSYEIDQFIKLLRENKGYEQTYTYHFDEIKNAAYDLECKDKIWDLINKIKEFRG